MQQWTRWAQRLPALGSHCRGADERGWTVGFQTVLNTTQSTKSYQVRGWCGEVAGATLGKVARASLIVTSEPAASPGEVWVWAWVWGPGEDPRWACSRIRDELHGLRPRSELEGGCRRGGWRGCGGRHKVPCTGCQAVHSLYNQTTAQPFSLDQIYTQQYF